jgi:hypothetical protein
MALEVCAGLISSAPVGVPIALFTVTEEHERSSRRFAAGGSDRVRHGETGAAAKRMDRKAS